MRTVYGLFDEFVQIILMRMSVGTAERIVASVSLAEYVLFSGQVQCKLHAVCCVLCALVHMCGVRIFGNICSISLYLTSDDKYKWAKNFGERE